MLGHYLLICWRFQPHDLSKQKLQIRGFTFQQCVSVIFDTDFYHYTVSCRHANSSAAETCRTASTAEGFQTINLWVFWVQRVNYHLNSALHAWCVRTKWSEVTSDSSDVCSCIPAQVVLSYELGNTESSWRFVWLNAAFHLSLWQIIKLMFPALWEMSMFNKHPANLDRCLVSVNRPRQGGLATAVTYTTARASELFPFWQH